MRKTHIKLGLLIAMTCLFLIAEAFLSNGTASAHTVQTSKKFHHWFAQAPHITLKLLSTTGRHSHHAYTGRAVIYGVGFLDCTCGPDTTTNPATNYSSPCDPGCGTSPSYTTTTTTTSSGSSTPNYNYGAPSSSTTCNSPCNSTPSYSSPAPSYAPSSSTPCNSSCNSTPSYSSPAPSYAPSSRTTCNSSCSTNSTPSYNYGAPAYNSAPGSSTDCDNSCNNSAPNYNTDPGSDCGCNTVNLQSSAPIFASSSNLTQVPVNEFGEFKIVVNVRPMPKLQTIPTIWAVNSYNDQPSNSAPMCFCTQ